MNNFCHDFSEMFCRMGALYENEGCLLLKGLKLATTQAERNQLMESTNLVLCATLEIYEELEEIAEHDCRLIGQDCCERITFIEAAALIIKELACDIAQSTKNATTISELNEINLALALPAIKQAEEILEEGTIWTN